MKGGDQPPECSICFDNILPSEVFSCGNSQPHIFHTDCARNYCISRQTRGYGYTFVCPICRDDEAECPPLPVTPLAPGATLLERPTAEGEGPPLIPPPLTDINIYFHAHSAEGLDRVQIVDNFFFDYEEEGYNEEGRRNALISTDNNTTYFDLLSQRRHGNEQPMTNYLYNFAEEYTDFEVDEILNNIGERLLLSGGNEYDTYIDQYTHYYIYLNRYDASEIIRNIWAIYGPGGVIENYGGQPLLRSREEVNTNPPAQRYFQDDVNIFEEEEPGDY